MLLSRVKVNVVCIVRVKLRLLGRLCCNRFRVLWWRLCKVFFSFWWVMFLCCVVCSSGWCLVNVCNCCVVLCLVVSWVFFVVRLCCLF